MKLLYTDNKQQLSRAGELVRLADIQRKEYFFFPDGYLNKTYHLTRRNNNIWIMDSTYREWEKCWINVYDYPDRWPSLLERKVEILDESQVYRLYPDATK